MKRKAFNLANKFLNKHDHVIVKRVNREERKNWVNEFLLKLSPTNIERVLSMEDGSKSQFKQDLFVLSELDFKTEGFFVEFGATNGIDISNTYLLEQEYAWNGIVAEPARGWHKALKRNRNCYIETDCVWSYSNQKLDFYETKKGVLSTINDFTHSDMHKRDKKNIYQVNTISLMDLLEKYNAPKKIDYLSIDTEGSEFEILSHFDFDKYDIKIITVEHNYNDARQKIFDILERHNYVRKFAEISHCDDWYVKLKKEEEGSI